MITQTEDGWQLQYEDYFQGNFKNKRMNSKQIAKQLTEIQSQIGKNIGVIWIKSTGNELLLLIANSP